ncbi:hypothetical protein AB4091_04860 [Terrabacter sp. 2RAF25]
MTGAAVPSPRSDRARSHGRLALSLLAGLLVAATAACSSGTVAPADSPAARPIASEPADAPTDPTPSQATPPSVPPVNAAITDPMKDLQAKHGNAVGTKPLLSQRGRDGATYTLEGRRSNEAFVTVSCPGPGRFTVTGDGEVLIGSVCTGSAAADIRLPLSSIGTTIAVQAPGPFWAVIAPATS